MHAASSWNLCVFHYNCLPGTILLIIFYFQKGHLSKPLLIGLFFMGQTQPSREYFI